MDETNVNLLFFGCCSIEQYKKSKGKTWSCGTNSRLPWVALHLSNNGPFAR